MNVLMILRLLDAAEGLAIAVPALAQALDGEMTEEEREQIKERLDRARIMYGRTASELDAALARHQARRG